MKVSAEREEQTSRIFAVGLSFATWRRKNETRQRGRTET